MSTTLTRFFFRAPYSLPRTQEVVRWWESRRPVYNLAVGMAGVASLAALFVLKVMDGGRSLLPPVEAVILYAVMANVCYTAGPIIDTVLLRAGGRPYSEVGPLLFRYGFVFSVGLTLLPVPLIALRILLNFLF